MMPVYTIETPSGRRVKIEAADEATAMLGAQEFEAGGGQTEAARQFRQEAGATSRNFFKPKDEGVLDAIRQGAGQGISSGWGDEIAAGLNTGFGYLGDYEKERDRLRGRIASARENHPVASTVGEIGGALATIPLAPQVSPFNAARAVGRIGNAAATGAAYGAAYGAGSANGDLTDRAVNALEQGAIGGAFGLGSSALIEGATGAGRAIAQRVRGVTNPEREAARRVGVALTRDGADLQQAQQTLQNARANADPLVIADTGAEVTRALARSAANTSPEARQGLNAVTNARFETQADRTTNLLQRFARGRNANVTREQLEIAARLANRPAYEAAYRQGPSVWSPDLEQLTTAPAVQAAIRSATKTGANRATAEGFKPPVNPFEFFDGGLRLRQGPNGGQAVPTLQFWDHVKRNLDDQYGALSRRGQNSAAADVKALKTRLVELLDQQVPAYKTARQGAAAFFGAEDALEAGQVFVTSRAKNADAMKAVQKMSAPERELFAEGFLTELAARVREQGDRRSVVNSIFLNSPAARERVEIALGPQRARELEAFLRTENVMDQLRTAIQGNSTTARQLQELGLAGGAAGISSLVNGFDPTDPHWWATVLFVRGGMLAGQKINENVARRVGEMLASNDPAVLQKAMQAISLNPKLMAALRATENAVSRLSGPVAGSVERAQQEPLTIDVTRPANWEQARPR